MKDNLDNELQIGDRVIYASAMWSPVFEVKEGFVTGFSPQKVRIHHTDTPGKGSLQKPQWVGKRDI